MDTNMQFTINSFRQLFLDKIFSLTFPKFLVKSLIFPYQLSNSDISRFSRQVVTLVFMYCSPKFDQLILTKIVNIVATRCQILRPKCPKFDFSWGSTPDSAGRAYSTPQTS